MDYLKKFTTTDGAQSFTSGTEEIVRKEYGIYSSKNYFAMKLDNAIEYSWGIFEIKQNIFECEPVQTNDPDNRETYCFNYLSEEEVVGLLTVLERYRAANPVVLDEKDGNR